MLEMLDEVEELNLVLQHYAITWGLKLPLSAASEGVVDWGQWGLKDNSKTEPIDES